MKAAASERRTRHHLTAWQPPSGLMKEPDWDRFKHNSVCFFHHSFIILLSATSAGSLTLLSLCPQWLWWQINWRLALSSRETGLIVSFVSLRRPNDPKTHKAAGPGGGNWAQRESLTACCSLVITQKEGGCIRTRWHVYRSHRCRNWTIWSTNTSAALSDINRISEAAQIASDVYVEPDSKKRAEHQGRLHQQTTPTNKWPLGLDCVCSALTRRWASGAKLYELWTLMLEARRHFELLWEIMKTTREKWSHSMLDAEVWWSSMIKELQH